MIKPSHFEANADHDIRLTTGISPATFFGSLGSFMSPVKRKLDDYRVRSVDLTYSVSNKYSGEAFTYSYLRQKGVSEANLLAYQLGFIYNLSNLGTLFKGEPAPKFFDYLSEPDPALGQNNMNHLVNRSVDLQSGFSLPPINLDLTGSLKYSKQYTLYRFFQPSDTTIIWPDYTISGTFNDFASKLPWFRTRLKSFTAYTNYNYRHQTKFDLFSPSPDEDKISYIMKPLLRLSATTNSNVKVEVSFNSSFDHNTQHGKKVGLNGSGTTNLLQPLTYLGGLTPYVPVYYLDSSQNSPQRIVTLGVAPLISWDLQTQKGIQFWRYYVKLQNSLRVTLNGSVDYMLSETTQSSVTHQDQNELKAMVKPQVDYNFTNNVDAKFWAQYDFDQVFNTLREEYTHTVALHGEFTMRF